MVDFRYHLVSIIAVFLALAVGIVVGTAALNGPIQNELNDNIGRLTSDKRSLEGSVRELQGQVAASDDFAAGVAPMLVKGALAEQRVLLVTTPQTPGELVDRLRPMLKDAGAAVTGQLEVSPALGEAEQRQVLEDLVAQVLPAGVKVPQGEPVERAAATLAAALTTRPGRDAIDGGEAQAVLSAFEEADLVRFTAEPGADEGALAQATTVVVLAPPSAGERPTTADQQRLEALVSLADAFDARAAGAVVAGPAPSAREGGLVKAVRDTSSAAQSVSTVDNAERGIGQVAVVLALAEQAAKGVGQYGAGPGATAPLPPRALS